MQVKILNSDFQNYHSMHKNTNQNKPPPVSQSGSKDIYTWEVKKIFKHLQNSGQYYPQTWLLFANRVCTLKPNSD